MELGVSLSLGALCLAAELGVGVAPFSVLGLEEAQGDALRQTVVERVSAQRRGQHLVSTDAVDEAIVDLNLSGEALQACLEEGPCAARVARRAGADRLVVGSAAGLGRSFMLRLNLVDARREVVEQEVQQSIEGGFDDLSEALAEQVDRLLGPPPIWRRWWLWTVVGVVVVAAAVVTAVVLTLPEDQRMPTYPFP